MISGTHTSIRTGSGAAGASAIVWLLAFWLVGCTGIVVEPVDLSLAQGSITFWGYTGMPGEAVRLEAQSSTWEQVATATTATTPTQVGGYIGYHFSVSYPASGMPTRFRRSSPWTGAFRAHFRVVNASGVAVIRQSNSNGSASSAESFLVRFWEQHSSNAGALRIDIKP